MKLPQISSLTSKSASFASRGVFFSVIAVLRNGELIMSTRQSETIRTRREAVSINMKLTHFRYTKFYKMFSFFDDCEVVVTSNRRITNQLTLYCLFKRLAFQLKCALLKMFL